MDKQDKNNIVLIGTIGNIETKEGGNQKYVNISVAVNETWKDKLGEIQKKTSWHKTVSFDEKIIEQAKSMEKGELAVIKGKLDNSTYEQEGQKRKSGQVMIFSLEKGDRQIHLSNKQQIEITGKLIKDAEVKTKKDGTEFLTMAIATNDYFKKDNAWQQKAHYTDITVYNKESIEILKQAKKGQDVSLKGNLDVSTWKDKEDKTRRSVNIEVQGGKDSITLSPLKEKTKEVGMDR